MWKRGMWLENERQILVKTFLVVILLFLNACSAQKPTDDDFLIDGKDPFTDPFFTDAQEWDSSVLQQSEVLSSPDPLQESEEPKSFTQKAEEAAFGTLLVGGMVAKLLFLPFLGL